MTVSLRGRNLGHTVLCRLVLNSSDIKKHGIFESVGDGVKVAPGYVQSAAEPFVLNRGAIVNRAMTGAKAGQCCRSGEVDHRERHRISISIARTASAITTGSEL